MEDGYFDGYGRSQTLILCTESFTKLECVLLQEALGKLGIVSTLKIRNKVKETYRIRISKKYAFSSGTSNTTYASNFHVQIRLRLGPS